MRDKVSLRVMKMFLELLVKVVYSVNIKNIQVYILECKEFKWRVNYISKLFPFSF